MPVDKFCPHDEACSKASGLTPLSPVVEHFNVIEDIRPGQIPGFVYGLRLGNGKYCTLRLFFVLTDINWPQRTILPFRQFFVGSPDIVSRQINVLPAQWRQV